jgi:riboflavin kinase/FMN adenylyltransferase
MPPVLRWRGLEQVPEDLGRSAVSIGVFDGVHRGHAAVLGAAVRAAGADGLLPVVVTFDPHPVEVLRPEVRVPRLATLERRLQLLEQLGVEAVLVLPFTEQTAAEPPEQFVAEVLVDALHAGRVVVGSDFRFGHKAAGDVPLLRTLGAAAGFTVDAVEPLGEGGQRWSSTSIRQALAEGRVEDAAVALGRPHRLVGMVERGEQRGRELGYPTANIAVAEGLLVPADGVYAGWLLTGSERLAAAVSVGSNPTFDATERTVEAYALDRDDLDLYGQPVALDLTSHLRAMERFAGVAELQSAMARDVERARVLLS